MTKWKDVKDGTKVRLIIDLYSMSEVHSDLHYQLLTKAEVDEIITLAYPAGTIFEFDSFMEHVDSEDGELGIDINGTIEPEYEIVK